MLKERSKDKNITSIIWTSDLTTKEHINKFLDKNDYIIQIWAEGTFSNGYKNAEFNMI